MKITLALLTFFLLACSKDDGPKFTSPEGNWTYTTPDGKIAVTFEVIKSGTNFDIKSQTITVDGTLCNAEKEVVNFTSTSVEKIRINANDAKVTYPFNIVFNSGVISDDFKKITVPVATYTFPWGTDVSLADIEITRK